MLDYGRESGVFSEGTDITHNSKTMPRDLSSVTQSPSPPWSWVPTSGGRSGEVIPIAGRDAVLPLSLLLVRPTKIWLCRSGSQWVGRQGP